MNLLNNHCKKYEKTWLKIKRNLNAKYLKISINTIGKLDHYAEFHLVYPRKNPDVI